jgi:hypothetical protein
LVLIEKWTVCGHSASSGIVPVASLRERPDGLEFAHVIWLTMADQGANYDELCRFVSKVRGNGGTVLSFSEPKSAADHKTEAFEKVE